MSEITEWWMILAMVAGGGLFAAGGTAIPDIGGQKWLRRFILPVLLGGIAFFNGFIWWRCLGYAVGQAVTLHLPYGDRTPYWLKLIVFMSYVLPSLFFGFTWWQVITPAVCYICFWLSNTGWASGTFLWKICEFIMGACVGITVANLIAQTYGG